MRALKWTVGMVMVVGVFGCASAPRPPLPEGMYRDSAAYLVGVERCSVDGFMEPATAAQGITQEQETLRTYRVDVGRHRYEIEQLRSLRGWSREACNAAAIKIHARAKEDERSIAYANRVREEQARMIQATTPHTTICNHLGNQSLCGRY